MADFSGLGLDPNVQENQGEFTVLPAGKYKACLVGDELKSNNAQTGKIWVAKSQVIEGQFSGEVLKDYVNITNPSATCQAIGQGTLRRICTLTNVPYPPTDTAPMMGKPYIIDVKVETFKSNTDGKELKSNKIKGYHPVDSQTTTGPAEADASPNGW